VASPCAVKCKYPQLNPGERRNLQCVYSLGLGGSKGAAMVVVDAATVPKTRLHHKPNGWRGF